MNKLTVFQFNDYRSFLKAKIDQGLYSSTGVKNGNLERLAQKIGYQSPSSLSMVMNGQRLPSENLATGLAEHWKMSMAEKEYFKILVLIERNKRTGRDNTRLIEKLNKLGKNKKSFQFLDDDFQRIKDWHFLVIKELAYTPEFRDDPEWISKKLRRKISPAQAKMALGIFEKLGFLVKNSDGILRPSMGFAETSHDLPSYAIRQHHKGMLMRAAEAIDEQEIANRQFNSLTLRVDPQKIPSIKEAILKFVKDFHTDNESESSNAVYQLSVQFFEHTKSLQILESASHELSH